MFKNLMFNRYTSTFHLSNNPFACIKRNEKLGYFGKAVKLSPTVYALITRVKLKRLARSVRPTYLWSTLSGLAFVCSLSS